METKEAPDAGANSWFTVPEVAQELRIPRSRAYELSRAASCPPFASASGRSA